MTATPHVPPDAKGLPSYAALRGMIGSAHTLRDPLLSPRILVVRSWNAVCRGAVLGATSGASSCATGCCQSRCEPADAARAFARKAASAPGAPVTQHWTSPRSGRCHCRQGSRDERLEPRFRRGTYRQGLSHAMAVCCETADAAGAAAPWICDKSLIVVPAPLVRSQTALDNQWPSVLAPARGTGPTHPAASDHRQDLTNVSTPRCNAPDDECPTALLRASGASRHWHGIPACTIFTIGNPRVSAFLLCICVDRPF